LSSYSEGSIRAPKQGEDEHLSRDEEQFIKRYLSRPESFPQEFWRAVLQKVSLDGEPIPASQVLGGKRSGLWQEYVPVWTSQTNPQPVVGNGAIGGQYTRIGDLVVANVQLVMGSTTTYGTNSYYFTLPVEATGIVRSLGGAVYDDTSATQFFGGMAASFAQANITQFVGWTSIQPVQAISPTIPFTWATADVMTFSLVYRSAS